MSPGKEHQSLTATAKTTEQLKNFMAIGIALSAEKNKDKLIEMVISEARRITMADAGTLYLRENDSLKIKIIHNESMQTFLSGKNEGIDLPLEARILAVADVFDALTASDRPYKKALPAEKALQVMTFMVRDGILDPALVEIFIETRVWERVENE